MVNEPTLFDAIEATPTFEQPKDRFWGAVGVKWTAHRGAHQPCAVYVRLCQEKGLAAVPKHTPASRKRVGPNGTLYICGMCAVDLEVQDNAAEVEAARRREAIEQRDRENRARRRNLA